MDFFYDGQIRRFVTQFMRIFIGFKYQDGDGQQKHVPVMYGDMTRQVASIIKENSENKMPTVPRVACYISGLEMDVSRLADPSFVSKLNIRERSYSEVDGKIVYDSYQGGGYTVERLMPTPFKLSMKADIWTSNTEQKLQLLEQILVLFNPSLEIQSTDNYIDWTSLSVVDLTNLNFSSRSIPAGAESEIDICSIDFSMPIWISPPAKVKKLGVVKNVIMNVFGETGQVADLQTIVYNGDDPGVRVRSVAGGYGVLLLKSSNGQPYDYDLSVINPSEAIRSVGLEPPQKLGPRLDWNVVLSQYGAYDATSLIHFLQPNGFEITGTFAINEADPTYMVVTLDPDTIPTNTFDSITAVVNPYTFNPVKKFGAIANIPTDTSYLMLEDVNNSANVGQSMDRDINPSDGTTLEMYDGPDAWKNLDGNDPLIKANTIIRWSGSQWVTVFDPATAAIPTYMTNQTTGIQYRWDGEQWLKSFEGEYSPGFWRLELDIC